MGLKSTTDEGAIVSWQDGFKLAGADKFGKCIDYDGSVIVQDQALDSDPVVSFEQDVSYQCMLEMNLPELSSFCGSQNQFIDQYSILNNLEEF